MADAQVDVRLYRVIDLLKDDEAAKAAIANLVTLLASRQRNRKTPRPM